MAGGSQKGRKSSKSDLSNKTGDLKDTKVKEVISSTVTLVKDSDSMESNPLNKDAETAQATQSYTDEPRTDEPQSYLKMLLQQFSVLSTEIREMSTNISEIKENIKSLKEIKKHAEIMREDIDHNTSRVHDL